MNCVLYGNRLKIFRMGQKQSVATDQTQVIDREEVLQAVSYATREVDVCRLIRACLGSL